MDSLTEDALRLAEIFNKHIDEHGHIHKEDLKFVLEELGLKTTDVDFDKLLHEMDVNDDGVLDLREFVTWITHEGDGSHVPQRSRVDQAAPHRLDRAYSHHVENDRVSVVCPVCGFKCYPQWMNDQAHCLKCDTVVRTRPSCHQRAAAKPKPKPRPTRNYQSEVVFTPMSIGASNAVAMNAFTPMSLGRIGTAVARRRNERVRMECPVCGYSSFPQWMNDKAHCLKCDAVIKRQPDIFGHMH